MNDQSPQPEDTDRPTAISALTPAASCQARRQLLRAVGASGALAGIGLPMAAHATTRPYCVRNSNNYHATASAVGSMIGSTTGSTPPIAGHMCSHYTSSGNWGTGYSNGRGCALTYNNCANTSTAAASKLCFWQVFELTNPGPPNVSLPTSRYCDDIIRLSAGTAEAHWLTAMFNANKRNTGGNSFAYTPTQIIDLYKGLNPLMGNQSNAAISGNALTLFRDYLSSMS